MSKETLKLALEEMKIGNYNSAAERLEAALAKQEQGELTDREQSVMRFALHRFVLDAMTKMNAAAQDKDNRHFKQGAVEAFSKDAKDAEALLEKLSAAHSIKE